MYEYMAEIHPCKGGLQFPVRFAENMFKSFQVC